MLARFRMMMAVGLVLVAGTANAQFVPAGQEAVAAANQKLAEAVASKLRGQIRGFNLEIATANGVVELIGTVSDESTRVAAETAAKSVAGVARVSNKLAVASVKQVQFALDAAAGAPLPGGFNGGAPVGLPAGPGGWEGQEPLPSYRAPLGGGHDLNPPPLPPYAWPTYAPYNNYSRVAYPRAYPSCVFPYIGPIHPFPKAPLGWRNVLLSFDDGVWYLSSHAGNRDWWTIRYW